MNSICRQGIVEMCGNEVGKLWYPTFSRKRKAVSLMELDPRWPCAELRAQTSLWTDPDHLGTDFSTQKGCQVNMRKRDNEVLTP